MDETSFSAPSEQIEATLLGLAVADALGAPLEASWAKDAAAAAAEGLEMIGGGGWGEPWDPGEWTDDTAMALCLAESMAENGVPLDLDDLARRYHAWAASGPKDIGTITSAALMGVASAEDAMRNARHEHERTGRTAGNGTIMRAAPLAFSPVSDSEVTEQARRDARLTHWDEAAAEASAALCLALRAVVRGQDPAAAAAATASHPRIEEAVRLGAAGDRRAAHELAQEGALCWATLGVALCGLQMGDYDEAVTWAISLGRDTDTNAAVTGALIACRDGADAIPRRWLDPLFEQERIKTAAAGLAALMA